MYATRRGQHHHARADGSLSMVLGSSDDSQGTPAWCLGDVHDAHDAHESRRHCSSLHVLVAEEKASNPLISGAGLLREIASVSETPMASACVPISRVHNAAPPNCSRRRRTSANIGAPSLEHRWHRAQSRATALFFSIPRPRAGLLEEVFFPSATPAATPTATLMPAPGWTQALRVSCSISLAASCQPLIVAVALVHAAPPSPLPVSP